MKKIIHFFGTVVSNYYFPFENYRAIQFGKKPIVGHHHFHNVIFFLTVTSAVGCQINVVIIPNHSDFDRNSGIFIRNGIGMDTLYKYIRCCHEDNH